MQVLCYLPLQQLQSDFGDFNNGVRHVSKITLAENDPDLGLTLNTTNISL